MIGVVIKKADKSSCVVVWDRNDYIAESEKQLSDGPFIKILILRIKFCKSWQIIVINCLEILKRKGTITEKELKYFPIEFKKATNLGKLYLLAKIHKCSENVPGRPVIQTVALLQKKFRNF